MFEKNIQHYLKTHNISVVLNNYKEIKEACNTIVELSNDDICLLYDLYNTKSDASNWINTFDKCSLFETSVEKPDRSSILL